MSVQALAQANVIVSGSRAVKLCAVVNGNILIGDPTTLLIASGGSSAFGTTDIVYAATIYSSVYFVSGSAVKRLDCSTGSVATLTATSGTVPTGCRLACNYRGRLILARDDASPHLWYASKLGDPTNWDYSAQTPIAAVSGNNARAGTIGDVLTALMPASDNVLFFGCDHSLYRLIGDPADGGTIALVSDQVGVISGGAWTQDPAGWIYFVSPQGLYRVSPGGALEQLSDARIESYFQEYDASTMTVTLCWDRDRKGLWILRTNSSGANSRHLFWSQLDNGYFPVKSANTDIRPLCALFYDGDSADDRRFCWGGASNKIYFYDEDATSDDGTAVSAYTWIGPTLPRGYHGEATAIMLDATIGEYPTRVFGGLSVNWSLHAAEDPYAALNASAGASGTWTTTANVGRQSNKCLSLRGRTFLMKLSDNNTSHASVYEKASILLQDAGSSY